jgi:SsrA-binding protein
MTAKPAAARGPVAQNRRARHDYDILGTYEAGIVLVGSEVKSFREGKVQLRDSFARAQDGEIWLHGMHVSPYGYATGYGMFDPDRSRKLLLHRREIDELDRETRHSPLTMVPLSAYFKDGRAKIELALARGRREYDKRRAIADREAQMEAKRAMGTHRGPTGGRSARRERSQAGRARSPRVPGPRERS